MKKKTVLNVIMVALIVMIAGFSVWYVGSTKGWFSKDIDTQYAITGNITGIADIERNGIGYSSDSGMVLKDGDILVTRSDSHVDINSGDNSFVLGENTEIRVISALADDFSFELVRGEVFCDISDPSTFGYISVDGNDTRSGISVFALDIQTGSSNMYVFDGTASFGGEEASGGQRVGYVGSASSKGTLSPASLNDFLISCAMATDGELALSKASLQEVIDAREAEIQEAIIAQQEHDAIIIAQGGTDEVITPGTSGNSSGSGSSGDPNIHNCTIKIVCSTILDNMDELAAGKSRFVPANGVILSTSRVQFIEGETVFDVLKRTCAYAGIQLEYSYTPLYGSYYIEGINNLYEFDCGMESGWIYKVNGWSPNVGCSGYVLKDGDVIVFAYTCKGYGADVK